MGGRVRAAGGVAPSTPPRIAASFSRLHRPAPETHLAAVPYRIRDPRRPEVMLWLSTLGPRERLIMLVALKFAFRRLENDREWGEMIRVACEALKPSPDENAEISVIAGCVPSHIRADLGEAS